MSVGEASDLDFLISHDDAFLPMFIFLGKGYLCVAKDVLLEFIEHCQLSLAAHGSIHKLVVLRARELSGAVIIKCNCLVDFTNEAFVVLVSYCNIDFIKSCTTFHQ